MSISSYLALATKQYGEKITEATPLPVGTWIRLITMAGEQHLFQVVEATRTGVWVKGATQTVRGPRLTRKIWVSTKSLASCNYRLVQA